MRVVSSLFMDLVVDIAKDLNFFQPSEGSTSSMLGSMGECPSAEDIVSCCWSCTFGDLQVDSKPWNSNSRSSRVLLAKFEFGLPKGESDPCDEFINRLELEIDDESGRTLGYIGNLAVKFERLLRRRLYE